MAQMNVCMQIFGTHVGELKHYPTLIFQTPVRYKGQEIKGSRRNTHSIAVNKCRYHEIAGQS